MENLRIAKQEYKHGAYFISATGSLKRPLKITFLKVSETNQEDIINVDGGVIYCADTNVWAKKV